MSGGGGARAKWLEEDKEDIQGGERRDGGVSGGAAGRAEEHH